jgi:hypothetical protein
VQVHFYRATRHLTREMRQRLRKSLESSVDRMSVRKHCVSQFVLWALLTAFSSGATGLRLPTASEWKTLYLDATKCALPALLSPATPE